MNILEVRNLTKKYPGFTLDGATFDVEEGCVMGFIGRNGAGKTTTIKCMLNLAHADGGQVFFEGKDLLANEAACKKEIGLVLGMVSYYQRKKLKTITEVTKQFYDEWDEPLYQSPMKRFALDPDKKVTELSQGMRVKYALALALSHHAKLLILDEPTSGLDPVSRDELLDIFQESEDETNIIIVEDVPLLLRGTIRMLQEELPGVSITGFSSGKEALQFAQHHSVSVAFLDIELDDHMDGLRLAGELTAINSQTNIIFLTSHAEYLQQAVYDHCSGYILKPLSRERIRHELNNLRFPVRGLSPDEREADL